MGIYYLGTFDINSSKIRVTDPSYTSLEEQSLVAGTINNVKNGKWQTFAHIINRGGNIKVKALSIYHNDYVEIQPTKRTTFDVISDSGQVGFFDFDYFKNSINNNFNNWYEKISLVPSKANEFTPIYDICTTIGDLQSVLSLSNEDISYPVFVGKIDKEVVSSAIIFDLSEDDEYSEYDDDEFNDDYIEEQYNFL